MNLASPYKGLAPFADSELDALFFFGRERDAEIVAANLVAARLTVLYGPSGVGKSSLLLTRVARTLRSLPESPLVVTFSSWGDDPRRALGTAMSEAAGVDGGDLLDVATRAEAKRDVYVIFDQTEEYFTYHADALGLGSALATLVAPPLRVNVLVSLREDALADLDRLKGQVPQLFANVLRLDRLDRAAGRSAIVGPLERWRDVTGEHVEADDRLVEAVLDGVRADLGSQNGGGIASNGGRGIEAPYLQLVMERVWNEEREAGSPTLRRDTLERLGGPRRIVADHLDRAMRDLDEAGRDVAAEVFAHLVTPSGTKIAHEAADLADYAASSPSTLLPVLDALVARRILRKDEAGRYEIFHDVLAAETLDWRRRHQTTRVLERERAAARRRQRRLGLVAGIALIGVALTAGLAIWALAERRNAEQQTEAAQAAEAAAAQQTRIAEDAQRESEDQAAAAVKAEAQADREAKAARKAEQEADAARAEAEDSAREADAARRRAVQQAEVAEDERVRADGQAELARTARRRALAEATAARGSRAAAEAARATAVRARLRADQAATRARASAKLSEARALLASDPEQALQAALESLELDPSARVEPVLREGLLRSRVTDVLPAGGDDVVAAFPEASTSPGIPLRSRPATGGDATVTATRDGVIRVFDSRTGVLRRSIVTGSPIRAAAPTADRRELAVGGPDGRVRVYDLATGQLSTSFDHVGAVLSIAWSGDGRYLATAGTNETAKLWNATTGELVHRLAHPRAVRTVSFEPDGTRLVTLTSDRFVRLFDVDTGRQLARLDQEDTPTAAVFSPDGRRILTAGQNERPRIWEAETGTLLATLEGHMGNVLSAAYAATGDKIVTASTDGTARVWDAETARLHVQLVGHTSFVDVVTFSPDGRRVLTASRDGTARLWNADTGASQAQFLGHSGRVTAVAFGADGRWALTAGEDGTARTWSLGDEPELRPIAAGGSAVTHMAVSGSGHVLAEGRADGAVNARDANGRLITSVHIVGPVTDVALSRDGRRLLATGEDGTVSVWRLPQGMRVAQFAHGAPATSGVLLPDGTGLLSAGRDGVVRHWSLETGRASVVARGSEPIVDLAVSSDGRLLAIAAGETARVRLLRGGTPTVLAGHRDAVTSVSFSGDGTRLVTSSVDHEVRIWDAATGKPLKSLVGHVAVVRDAAFSPDGRWVVSAGPTRAGLWETGASSLLDSRLTYLGGHRGAIAAVVFGPTAWTVYSGGVDGTLRRYDCKLCAGVDVLRRIAASKLARLAADAKR